MQAAGGRRRRGRGPGSPARACEPGPQCARGVATSGGSARRAVATRAGSWPPPSPSASRSLSGPSAPLASSAGNARISAITRNGAERRNRPMAADPSDVRARWSQFRSGDTVRSPSRLPLAAVLAALLPASSAGAAVKVRRRCTGRRRHSSACSASPEPRSVNDGSPRSCRGFRSWVAVRGGRVLARVEDLEVLAHEDLELLAGARLDVRLVRGGGVAVGLGALDRRARVLGEHGRLDLGPWCRRSARSRPCPGRLGGRRRPLPPPALVGLDRRGLEGRR